MKPEPLKGKMQQFDTECYSEKDIKSAVEWLKEKLEENRCNRNNLYTNSYIDEAFEDVMKE